MIRIFALACALVLSMTGCSMSADTAAAEQAVATFHELLNAGHFPEIYEHAADEFKKATTQPDFLALLAAVHGKLGMVKSAQKQGWSASYHTSGTFITLTYKTSYAAGEAGEQFSFLLHGKVPELAGYHITSNALILK